MKFCVFVVFKLCPWIVYVGDWALKWTEGNEEVQVFFVMLFFPLIMNALQYYIIDGFIKGAKPADHDALPQDEDDGTGESRPPPSANAWDASFDSEEETDALKHGNERVRLVKPVPELKVDGRELEYDPAADGDDKLPDSGSSSRPAERPASSRTDDRR